MVTAAAVSELPSRSSTELGGWDQRAPYYFRSCSGFQEHSKDPHFKCQRCCQVRKTVIRPTYADALDDSSCSAISSYHIVSYCELFHICFEGWRMLEGKTKGIGLGTILIWTEYCHIHSAIATCGV
jgi:hypothetical protein